MTTINELKQKQEELKKQRQNLDEARKELQKQEKELTEKFKELDNQEQTNIRERYPDFSYDAKYGEITHIPTNNIVYEQKNMSAGQLEKVLSNLQKTKRVFDLTPDSYTNVSPQCGTDDHLRIKHYFKCNVGGKEFHVEVCLYFDVAPTIWNKQYCNLNIQTTYSHYVEEVVQIPTPYGTIEISQDTDGEYSEMFHRALYVSDKIDVPIKDIIREQIKLLQERID